MKIGPKYKIARRLGASVFDKTQTAKFTASQSRKKDKGGKGRPKTNYGIQMLEKQKARFTYGLNERQFRTYVNRSLAKHSAKPVDTLYEMLESRLDNVVYRIGLANSRQFGRQLVSHGHIMVNGVKVTIPSYQISPKDVVRIREASQKKRMFENIEARLKDVIVPSWIKFDFNKKEAIIESSPKLRPRETIFDIKAIIEFYQR